MKKKSKEVLKRYAFLILKQKRLTTQNRSKDVSTLTVAVLKADFVMTKQDDNPTHGYVTRSDLEPGEPVRTVSYSQHGAGHLRGHSHSWGQVRPLPH